MKLKFTPAFLEKLEKIISEAGYILRYERGTFQSGYCILESKKVVVLNKFLQTEGRINTLIDLIPVLKIETDHISVESRKFYEEVIVNAESVAQTEEAV
ncbi:MAG: hypothetical protein RL463_691 [Bacteroidota bacterium]|jgi:hypothetical protein